MCKEIYNPFNDHLKDNMPAVLKQKMQNRNESETNEESQQVSCHDPSNVKSVINGMIMERK